MVGYALTGVTTEHALFFLYGTGANGKSVFVNTIAAILALGRWLEECCVLGPNCTETSADLFAGWKVWAEANGEFAGSQRRFSDLMLARGFDKWRDPGTDRRGLLGVALRDQPPATAEMEFRDAPIE
jgi:phage/plasmid-associated DNA primase